MFIVMIILILAAAVIVYSACAVDRSPEEPISNRMGGDD